MDFIFNKSLTKEKNFEKKKKKMMRGAKKKHTVIIKMGQFISLMDYFDKSAFCINLIQNILVDQQYPSDADCEEKSTHIWKFVGSK